MRTLFLLFTLIISPVYLSSSIPADLSFIVIDLKYNSNDGVKICETQQGIGCAFEGPEFFEGRRTAFGALFVDFLEPYFDRYWYVKKGMSGEFRRAFKSDAKWKAIPHFSSIFTQKSSKKYVNKHVKDKTKLSDYHGLFTCYYKGIDKKKLQDITGVIFLNRAFLQSFGNDTKTDKLGMSNLFTIDEKLSELKPDWNLYPKGYSQELIDQIKEDFSSDLLVIKPRAGFQGRGIIILHKDDLADTLAYIFSGDPILKQDPDKAHNWWATDKHDNFLIEEFIESDPVYAPHLSDDLYDGTMRVPIVFTYDQGVIDLQVLYMWWKLPPKSLNEEGSLNEKHKSFSQAPNTYVLVEPEVRQQVERQLKDALPILYQHLLDNGH